MANFLPFVDENSEESILKTILKRSKGSRDAVTAHIFATVLKLGVDVCRKEMDLYSKDTTMTEKIQRLLNENPDTIINATSIEYWSCIMNFVRTNNQKHPVFNQSELEVFFAVLAITRPEKLTFGVLPSELSTYTEFSSKDFNAKVDFIPNVKLTGESSTRVGFTSWEEFKAYLAILNCDGSSRNILPVFINTARHDTTVNTYIMNGCESPYVWS